MAGLQLESHLLRCSCVWLLLSNFVICQDTCQPYGIRRMSKGTSGFPTLFHIEVLEDQTDLHVHDSRQVLIPSMSFNCSGSVTKWTIPAVWEGETEAFPEMQIWRRTVENLYLKVGATTIQVARESASKLYEIAVDPPLDFQEGDILGYFQPYVEVTQLNIYLENSMKIVTFRDILSVEQTQPPTSPVFDLAEAGGIGEDYPLIAVETDPPNCGCGMPTIERITTLLNTNRESFGFRNVFPQEQSVFPNIQFTYSGRVVKWIVGATYSIFERDSFPELQIWRPTSGSTFQKQSGTTLTALADAVSGIYEFLVQPPLPFQPGDVLGLFQPSLQRSKLFVDFEVSTNAAYYYLPLDETAVEPTHTFIDIAIGGWRIGRVLPLVTVEIVLDMSSTTTTTTISNLATTPTPTVLTTSTMATQTMQPTHILSSTTVTPMLSKSPTVSAPTTQARETTQNLQEPVETFVYTTKSQSIQTSSVDVASTTTRSAQNLMFYVSIGVVVILTVLILVLVVVLIIVLRSPRKEPPKLDSAQNITLESREDTHYELYTDVSSLSSPNSSDNVFDDPIYNEPSSQQNSTCTGKDYSSAATDGYTPTIMAYAISNVTDSALTATNDHEDDSNDYDYAEP